MPTNTMGYSDPSTPHSPHGHLPDTPTHLHTHPPTHRTTYIQSTYTLTHLHPNPSTPHPPAYIKTHLHHHPHTHLHPTHSHPTHLQLTHSHPRLPTPPSPHPHTSKRIQVKSVSDDLHTAVVSGSRVMCLHTASSIRLRSDVTSQSSSIRLTIKYFACTKQ